jgi:hypothetical protein
MVFENWLLRRIFRSKRREMAGSWIGLHNEELHNLYASLNIMMMDKVKDDVVGGICSFHG